MSTITPDSDARICGSAECAAYTPSSESDQDPENRASSTKAREQQHTQAIRTDILRQRLHQVAQGAPNFQVVGSGSSLSTSALQALKSGTSGLLTSPEPQCLIGYQVRVGNKVDTVLGAGVKPYSMASFLGDVKIEIVKKINIEWTCSGRPAVLVDEVGFRWSGNRSLEENTTTLTLRDFFQYYNQRMNVNTSIGIQNVPSIFKASVKNHKAMPMAFFDMLLYHAEYKERITATGRVDEYSPSAFLQSALKSVAKRPRNTSSATLESTKASKQQNVGLAGVSSQFTPMFKPSTRPERATVQLASNVTFSKLISLSESTTGKSSLLATDSDVTGLLSNKSMAHGTMKIQFIVPGLEKRFVAKRFFRSEAMADDDDHFIGIDLLYVTPVTHLALMEDEILRLAEVSWFLKEFYRYCRKEYPQITVEKRIQIAEAYVGTETNTYPSLASGLPRQHTGPGMSWLIEEKRSLSVTKFSGTLQHDGSRHDPISTTVYAFSHFALWHSKGTCVFADLQGTLTNVNGMDTMILFDIMSHTLDGESGIGDFGQQGIDSFINTHCCSTVCEALQLNKMQPVDMENNKKSDEEVDPNSDDKEEGELEENE
ncbi:hypothetical protein D9619_008264 [Psilocybe cf. subviscida]|uniref:Alpha-type protein kinase domain-containing protein n=1 Tax=Psilocybe cf. subviscida TaxID=2480587 RepID=A0A8H5ATH1_9AGAR|nr:hypothetical protein D9619_008264 [Psilocybe cf. subviscida]